MFLDDQRAASCPLQDQHLLPFGHSAPNLLTPYRKNKHKSVAREQRLKGAVGPGIWVSGFGKYPVEKF